MRDLVSLSALSICSRLTKGLRRAVADLSTPSTAMYKVLGASAIVLMATGCAGSVPEPKFIQAMPPASRIAASDEANVKVDQVAGVAILESEKARLAEIILQKINGRKLVHSQNAQKREYEVDLLLTRYDKGSAFARAMLAGLGQIHIDGEVTLIELPERRQVGKFSISKTFAWGGIYGATTSMDDIEQTFADGIAAALTGQTDEDEK